MNNKLFLSAIIPLCFFYNTFCQNNNDTIESQFDFEKTFKLEFSGTEEDIIKAIENGDTTRKLEDKVNIGDEPIIHRCIGIEGSQIVQTMQIFNPTIYSQSEDEIIRTIQTFNPTIYRQLEITNKLENLCYSFILKPIDSCVIQTVWVKEVLDEEHSISLKEGIDFIFDSTSNRVTIINEIYYTGVSQFEFQWICKP